MALRFVTVSEIRLYTGLSIDLISDADLTDIGEDIEYQVEKFLNCSLTPTLEIESQDGNQKQTMFTNKAPLLSLRQLTIDGTAIDLENTHFERSGRIRLLSGSLTFTGEQNKVYLKYIHGRVAWDRLTSTTTTANTTNGTSVAIDVTSNTGFAIGNWIEISSFDGNKEVAQITAIPTGKITVDSLVLDHLSGATIRLLTIDNTIKRYIKIWTSIAAVTRAVGQSFDDITGYTMGEFSVQKGEPYTQFRETIQRLEDQARDIERKLRPIPGIQI